jgi:hypothetical protein
MAMARALALPCFGSTCCYLAGRIPAVVCERTLEARYHYNVSPVVYAVL